MFTLAAKILQLFNLVLIVYCFMSFLMPGNSIFQKLQSVIEPILAPVRRWLYQRFPRLIMLPVDLTPMAIWLAIQFLVWLLRTLAFIF